MKRSEKKDFVSNLKEDFSNATSVIVAEYSGLTVNETEQLRKEMRDNGAKFKVTKNRLTKLAISETQFKDISELFKGPTAIAYSDDAVAPAKVAVSFEKKFEKFKIIGGGYNGEKIDKEKWYVYFDNGREATNIDVIDWAKEVQKMGAGEILITSIGSVKK